MEMDLPKPRRPFRAPSARRHADCANGSAYGVGARSASRGAREYPSPSLSGAVRDEGMERVVAAVTVSRDRERLGLESRPMAFASDVRKLGVGTSMRGSGGSAAPISEGYPEQGRDASNTTTAGSGSARADSGQATETPRAGALGRTPPPRLTDGAANASQTATEPRPVSSADTSLPGQTPSWIGADGSGGAVAPVPSRGRFPIATGWDARQAEDGYHDNRSGDSGQGIPIAHAGRPKPGFARIPPPAAAFGNAEQWDGVELGRGEYGRGVSGRPR